MLPSGSVLSIRYCVESTGFAGPSGATPPNWCCRSSLSAFCGSACENCGFASAFRISSRLFFSAINFRWTIICLEIGVRDRGEGTWISTPRPRAGLFWWWGKRGRCWDRVRGCEYSCHLFMWPYEVLKNVCKFYFWLANFGTMTGKNSKLFYSHFSRLVSLRNINVLQAIQRHDWRGKLRCQRTSIN